MILEPDHPRRIIPQAPVCSPGQLLHPGRRLQPVRPLQTVAWAALASVCMLASGPGHSQAPAATTAAAAAGSAGTAPKLVCGLSNGQRAQGEPIYLGGIVSKTGPDDFSASGAAANAYFRCINDNGGIHGRPVIYTLADDQWDPKLANELASRLLKERNVVAMVGGSSFVECSANAALYGQNGITALVGTGVPKACFHSPHIAPVNTGPRLSATIAAMQAHKLQPAKRMACVIHVVPGLSDWACDGVRDWGRKNGIAVDVVTFEVARFNPGAVLTQVAAGKPDVVVMNLPKGLLLPLMAEAQKMDLGQSMRFASSAPAYNPDVAKALGPYWKGRMVANLEFLPVDSSGADNQNWRAVMNKYALKTDTRDAFSQSGYLAARIATEALLSLKPERIARKEVNDAIRRVRQFNSDMLCRPMYVGNGKRHNASYSGPVASYDGNHWVVADNSCITAADPELADIVADEKRMGLK